MAKTTRPKSKPKASITFPDSDDQIKIRLGRVKKHCARRLRQKSNVIGKEMVSYMKNHHPWQNRTGNAERGLYFNTMQSQALYVTTLEFAHTVPYGVYLEKGMGLRFAVIEPTIRLYAPRAIQAYQNILEEFKYDF